MKKILLMFLLVIGLLLTGCGSTSDDPGDDNPKDPTGVTDPLDGIDEALVLLMDGDFEGEFDGNTISYYFYLPVHTEFTFSLDADFDSLIVIKELLTSNIVFEGDDSIFGDDVNSFISLDAGEYVVELSSREDRKSVV